MSVPQRFEMLVVLLHGFLGKYSGTPLISEYKFGTVRLVVSISVRNENVKLYQTDLAASPSMLHLQSLTQ
jgi:hypothetical protein